VYAVVRQSGGGLQVSSELGRGTSVKVFLPRIDRPVLLESVEHRQAAAHATEAILVVEDDDMVRHLVRETLEREGYKIMDAAGPVEARRLMEQYAGPFHLLITDVVMPKVNGRQLAGQLLRKRPDLKVLYMSGYADADILKTGLMRRKVSFLQKPFTPRALSEKVREVLHGDRLTRGAG
jgi:DNA-binding NtrC family response regulator